VFAVDIVIRDTARPAGFSVDAGTTDARIILEVFKIMPELQDQRVGQPDFPDTVFSYLAVDELRDGLANPAESDITGAQDPEDRTGAGHSRVILPSSGYR
jgi:hypothetical protein